MGNALSELRARIEALEERVARLEKGEAPPGDGRRAVPPFPKGTPRCPGCGLELRRRRGRCVECGFPLQARSTGVGRARPSR